MGNLVNQIDPATMATIIGWPGSPGDMGGLCLTSDGTYVYNGTGATWTRATVVKLDIATMTEVDRWTGGADDYDVLSVLIAGGYLYAGLRGAAIPAGFGTTVVKIDPATMTEVLRWAGGDDGDEQVRGLVFDGVNLYAGVRSLVVPSPGTGGIIQFDIATMNEVARWVCSSVGIDLFSIGYDGAYLYAGMGNSGWVIQIDPLTMLPVNDIVLGGLYGTVFSLAHDGAYMYAATGGTGGGGGQPGTVDQIDPATMSVLGEWPDPGPNGEQVLSLTWLAPYIYAGIGASPSGAVVQIDTTTMLETDRWTGAVDEPFANSLTNDGTYLYVGLLVEIPLPPAVGGARGSIAVKLQAAGLI